MRRVQIQSEKCVSSKLLIKSTKNRVNAGKFNAFQVFSVELKLICTAGLMYRVLPSYFRKPVKGH